MGLSKLSVATDYVQVAKSVLSKMESESIPSELGIPTPVGGGDTGDLSGRYEILAPWTCEDCSDPYSVIPGIAHDVLGKWETVDRLKWGDLWSNPIAIQQGFLTTWPDRCTSCDSRYRQHKRTTNAIVRIWRHPRRMEKFENTWVYLKDQKYRYLKFICLTQPNIILTKSQVVRGPENGPSPLEVPCTEGRGPVSDSEWISAALEQSRPIIEKFRRFRKKKFWTDHVVYGRWFFEVTWTVHYADGSSGPTTQWMPGEKELDGAISIEMHPHLHVIAVSEFMDKENLSLWWGAGTQIQAVDSWWSTKKYLTKYLNKSQVPGRNQGTFGKTM